MKKREAEALGALAVFAIIIGGIVQFFEAVGFVVPLVIAGTSIAGVALYRRAQRKARQRHLLSKYGDAELVQRILDGTVWQGQSVEELTDSLGQPADIDQKVLKTKKKEIWKYNHEGGNRYRLRITLENDVVVGWDQR